MNDLNFNRRMSVAEYHDLARTGVLRTLLHSIEAHEWNTGRSRGYVAFLEKFIEEGRLPEGRLSHIPIDLLEEL